MKRFFCLLLIAVFLLIFTACGSSETLNPSYTGKISFSDGNTAYSASLTADGNTLTLTMESPENVTGLCYTFRDGELHTALDGLECINMPDSLPSSSVPRLLFELFSRSEEAEYQTGEDGVDTYTLRSDGGDLTVTAKDGVPQTLTYGSRVIRFS